MTKNVTRILVTIIAILFLTSNAIAYPSINTSDYMIGSVVVGLVFTTSDGTYDLSTETWTIEEMEQAETEVKDALDWWRVREPRANLNFTIVNEGAISTKYEPINRPYSDNRLWIPDVMTKMGYTETHGWYCYPVYHYVNYLRDTYNTDWAFVIFIVDSSNDKDDRFTDGQIAASRPGGPFVIATLGAGPYGTDNLDSVIAHEVGHIFWATDQYHDARVPCNYKSGYLQIENQNSEYGDCLLDEPSIMRCGVAPYLNGALDQYARGQIGWRDSDLDNILDPIDDMIDPVHHLYLPNTCTN